MDVLQNIQRQMESEVAEIKRIENGKFILIQRECAEYRKVVQGK